MRCVQKRDKFLVSDLSAAVGGMSLIVRNRHYLFAFVQELADLITGSLMGLFPQPINDCRNDLKTMEHTINKLLKFSFLERLACFHSLSKAQIKWLSVLDLALCHFLSTGYHYIISFK